MVCEKCLENAECLGGYIPVYPKKNVNYLLLINNTSDNINSYFLFSIGDYQMIRIRCKNV